MSECGHEIAVIGGGCVRLFARTSDLRHRAVRVVTLSGSVARWV
jgi:hypothetical protein